MAMDIEDLHSIPTDVYNSVISRIQEIQNRISGDSTVLFERGGDMVLQAQDAIRAISETLVELDAPGDPGPMGTITGPADYFPADPTPVDPVQFPSGVALPTFTSNVNASFTPVAIPAPPTAPPSPALPSLPVVDMPTAPTAPVVDFDVALPVSPNLAMPSAPVIHGITLPALPTLNFPTFLDTLPDWVEPAAFVPDNIYLKVGDVTYDDTLLNEFAARALQGTPATVTTVTQQETARLADQINAQADRDVVGVWDEFASRGFTAPAGTVGQRVDAIRLDASNKVRLASRDVAMKRMEVEVEAYRTNMTAGVDLAKKQIDKSLEVKKLELEIHTATARQMIDMYNASVEVFKAQQLRAQSAVDIFKAKIEAEAARVNIFKAQVEGAKLGVDAEVAQMQGYEAQVRGVLAMVDVYKAQVSAAQSLLDAKSKRVEAFRTEVEAFSAQVGAARTQYEVYEAQVKANIVPVTLYESQVRAYAASLEGVKANADLQRTAIEASVSVGDGQVRAYVAQADMALKQMDSLIASAKAQGELKQSAEELKVTSERVKVESYSAQGEVYKTKAHLEVAKYESLIKKWQVNQEIMERRVALRVEASKAAAQVSGQLAASALAGFHIQSGMNGSTNLGFTGNTAGHWQYNYGENHQFQGE